MARARGYLSRSRGRTPHRCVIVYKPSVSLYLATVHPHGAANRAAITHGGTLTPGAALEAEGPCMCAFPSLELSRNSFHLIAQLLHEQPLASKELATVQPRSDRDAPGNAGGGANGSQGGLPRNITGRLNLGIFLFDIDLSSELICLVIKYYLSFLSCSMR